MNRKNVRIKELRGEMWNFGYDMIGVYINL